MRDSGASWASVMERFLSLPWPAFPAQTSPTRSFDIEESSRVLPPLTTVHQDLYQQGQDCARRLITPGAATTLLHPTRLIVRASTARSPEPP